MLQSTLVVLVDFDGTIVNVDTAELVLQRFADGDWATFDQQLERGAITLEECVRKQFSLVKASENEILSELDRAVTLRPNFEKLVALCKRQGFPIAIVSAGLDFCLRHILLGNPLFKEIELDIPKAQCTSDGMKFTSFPKLRYSDSHNFKDDLVRYYQRQGSKVAYLGDALIDYHAVKNADLPFAVKGSDLADACDRDGVPYTPFTDFSDVIAAINQAD
jgi:2,3-diketo-5-methylthio-1-phosphopentane phosphatase